MYVNMHEAYEESFSFKIYRGNISDNNELLMSLCTTKTEILSALKNQREKTCIRVELKNVH